MAVSGIGSNAAAVQHPVSKPQQQALEKLREAVAGGDLPKARQSFAILKQNLPGGVSPGDDVSKAFDNLGKALAAGDLSQVKDAFSELQVQLKTNVPQKQMVASSATPAAGQPTDATGTRGEMERAARGVNLIG